MSDTLLRFDTWPRGTPEEIKRTGPPNAVVSRDVYDGLAHLPGWKVEFLDGRISPEPHSWPVVFRFDKAAHRPERRLDATDIDVAHVGPNLTRRQRALLVRLAQEAFCDDLSAWGETRPERDARMRSSVISWQQGKRGAPVGAFIAARREVPVGCLLVRTCRGGVVLETLGVVPSARGLGIASRLLESVLASTSHHVDLLSTCLRANRPSILWHAVAGFRELPDDHITRMRLREAVALLADTSRPVEARARAAGAATLARHALAASPGEMPYDLLRE